jgi:probable F420-dependent oxidoreductase
VKVGIVTPVLTRLPRTHAKWEREAGIAEVARVVVEAERLGYVHATCSEHVAVPIDVAEVRGATYWDPLPVFGYLAAQTSRIELVTSVLVLGYHHPLAIAKRYGTLDAVSGGRLVLGVGVGSLREEFELLGAQFEDRGARGDDAIRALRASLGRREPAYEGTHYSFSGFLVDPCAPRTDVPIWVGGRTARSLRRAVELADGWMPFGLRVEEMAAMVAHARTTDAWATRTSTLAVVLGPNRALDPLGDPDATRAAVAALGSAGATTLSARFVHHSLDHYCEQLAALLPLLDD